ncbi:MAG: porin family protein [Pseudomonadota bacterium]
MKKIYLFGLWLFMAVPASAEGLYIIGDFGQSNLSYDFGNLYVGTTDTTFSVGAGYAVDRVFSFEVAYRDFGSFTMFKDDYERNSIDGEAIQVSLIAKYAAGDLVNLYGRVGIADLTYDAKTQYFDYPEDNETTSESKTKLFFGVGASYACNERVSLRAEYNKYSELEQVSSSVVTIGATYSF